MVTEARNNKSNKKQVNKGKGEKCEVAKRRKNPHVQKGNKVLNRWVKQRMTCSTSKSEYTANSKRSRVLICLNLIR